MADRFSKLRMPWNTHIVSLSTSDGSAPQATDPLLGKQNLQEEAQTEIPVAKPVSQEPPVQNGMDGDNQIHLHTVDTPMQRACGGVRADVESLRCNFNCVECFFCWLLCSPCYTWYGLSAIETNLKMLDKDYRNQNLMCFGILGGICDLTYCLPLATSVLQCGAAKTLTNSSCCDLLFCHSCILSGAKKRLEEEVRARQNGVSTQNNNDT